MKTVINYLDDLKVKTGSDYKSAQVLNTTKSTISMARKRGQIGNKLALKIAEQLGINREEILFAAAMARSEGTLKRTMERMENLSKNAGNAASVVAVFGLIKSMTYGYFAALFDGLFCILCKIVNLYRFDNFKSIRVH